MTEPETLGEKAWTEYLDPNTTEPVAEKLRRLQHARIVERNIRQTMTVLRRMGWPGRWPRELFITHRGRE